MFKLIYSLSDKGITLKYRKRDYFWSRELLIAFSIALFVHASAFAIFQVKKITSTSSKQLKPSLVVSEVISPKKVVISEYINAYGVIETTLPKPISLQGPKIDWTAQLIQPFQISENKDRNFSTLPNNFYLKTEALKPQALEFFKEIKPLKVLIYGELASRFEGLNVQNRKVLFDSTVVLRSRFDVQIEDRTGEVFDAILMESCGLNEYDQYSLNLIKSLHFEPVLDGAISKSEVEIILELDKAVVYD